MENPLRHIAVAFDGIEECTSPSVSAALERAGVIAESAFARVPGLVAFSLFSPEIQEWIAAPVTGPGIFSGWHAGIAALAGRITAAGAALRVLGRWEELGDPWRGVLSPFTLPGAAPRTVNLFLNYSSRLEIAAAADEARRSAPGGVPVTDEDIGARLLTAGEPDPDLLIVVSTVLDPKDFLLWQASYAEIWHAPKRWSGFTPSDLQSGIESFGRRERRFGGV